MTAALRTFAMLCAGPLAILLAGLPALLRTGQVDLRAWMWPALVLILASVILRRRRSAMHAIWAGVGGLSILLLFVWLATRRLPDLASSFCLGLTVILAVGAGIIILRQRWLGLSLAGLAVLTCWIAAEPSIERAEERPALAVITALPLFWREEGGGVAAREDAPIITVLRQRFDVRPVDSVLPPNMRGVAALLIAQPRSLPPAELAALDDWVHAGGKLLLLADPMLRWPSSLPIGDRRRPPAISMLSPLLAHWGVDLLPPSSTGEGRQTLEDGRLLTTMAASSFGIQAGSSCRAQNEGLVARCRIGHGQAVLIADADLIDDRLWLADSARALSADAWSADTPGFLVDQLNGGPIKGRPWLTSLPALMVALRFSVAAGIIWAVLGTMLLGRRGKALHRSVRTEETAIC